MKIQHIQLLNKHLENLPEFIELSKKEGCVSIGNYIYENNLFKSKTRQNLDPHESQVLTVSIHVLTDDEAESIKSLYRLAGSQGVFNSSPVAEKFGQAFIQFINQL